MRKLLKICGTVVGGLATVFSFYPRLTVSDPQQMDTRDFFSYAMTVTNDGLPVFGTKWALALGTLTLTAQPNRKALTVLLPLNADWTVKSSVLATAVKPSDQPHAGINVFPGSRLIGPSNYGFRLMPEDNYIGFLLPGDKSAFTTEGLIVAPEGSSAYETLDFAISIKYIPLFPPIPMQTCSNFRLYRDRTGAPHWFRAPNQCDRFPWMHR